jgi:hypothetical protein
MKIAACKFRLLVAPPELALTTQNTREYFEAGDVYDIEDIGPWLRITHKETGRSRKYPIALCFGADDVVDTSAKTVPAPQQGKRRG